MPEIIRKMFPGKSNDKLSQIWSEVYDRELTMIFNRPTVNIVKLDDVLIAEYGEYEGSMKDFIIGKFGEDFMKQFKEVMAF